MKRRKIHILTLLILSLLLNTFSGFSQSDEISEIDKKVRAFLEKNSNKWRDMNVPRSDGQLLYNLIIENNYTKALEIGTSTGHSGIWIAWALSKTGGKLITIDVDESRHEKALENFKEAGVSDFIDARLADAHQLVPELKGPFDFVFCDADKNWYKNYFIDVIDKLEKGGCFTAHNVLNTWQGAGIKEFVDYVKNLPYMRTTIDNGSSSGVSISYKQK
jgi:predicted O-methyltransferase YrrM